MSSTNRVVKLFSLMKSGKPVARAAIAKHLGYNESFTQALMRYFAERGIPIEATKVEGRAQLEFTCTDVAKFQEIVDNGGRMRVAQKVKVPAKAAPKGKQLSAKQAGKAAKRVPKVVKEKLAQNHLDDAPGVFDDRPASERKGKAAVLDKDLDIAHVTEREFNDIKSMLGIDL